MTKPTGKNRFVAGMNGMIIILNAKSTMLFL